MLENAYFLAKIGADTAENEQHFAEILPKTGNYPTGPVRELRRQRKVAESRWRRRTATRRASGSAAVRGPPGCAAGTPFRGLVLGCIEAKFCK